MAEAADKMLAGARERIQSGRITQQEFATALGVTQGHLSKVLSGKVPLSNKMKVRIQRCIGETPDLMPRMLELSDKDVRMLSASVMQNMQNVLTDLQRLCDGIAHLVRKRR